MAASLRQLGSTKKYFICGLNKRTLVLAEAPKKFFHTQYLTAHPRHWTAQFPHEKPLACNLVNILGVRYASNDAASNSGASTPPSDGFILDTPPVPTSSLPEGYILDTPPVPVGSETAKEMFSLPDLTPLGEPTLQSLGFAGGKWYSPTGTYEALLQFMHVNLDVPWWVAISIMSVCFRFLIIPVVIWQRKSLIQHSNTYPEFTRLKSRLEEAKLRGNRYEIEVYNADFQAYQANNPIPKYGLFLPPFMQMPLFLTVFGSLRHLCDYPVHGLKEGGSLWFLDLTIQDPLYLIPLISSVTLAAMLEFGSESQKVSEKPFFLKCLMRCIPVVTFIFLSRFPAALGVHVLTNNFFSVIQGRILRSERVKKALNMPQEKPMTGRKGENFMQETKTRLKAFRSRRQLEDRKAVASMDFKSAGQGPVPKTYSYNPKKKKLSAA